MCWINAATSSTHCGSIVSNVCRPHASSDHTSQLVVLGEAVGTVGADDFRETRTRAGVPLVRSEKGPIRVTLER